jgi:membrane protein YdbS with pleckstrin-like domain
MIENPQIHLDDLPKVQQLRFVSVERKYRYVLYIISTIWFIFLLIGLITLITFRIKDDNVLKWLLIGLWLGLYLFSLWFSNQAVKAKSYAVRGSDISFQSGVWFKSWITVPFNRVQHCELSKGLLDNTFNLVELKIYTAGGSGSDLAIPGLDPTIANRLKEFVIGKMKEVDEEE